MTTYAILGATGSTGSSILHLLLTQHPKTKINLLVRSKQKLLSAFPQIKSNPNIQIFQGSISNSAVLTQCIANVHAVFMTVAVTENYPDTTIAQDTAKAVVSSLQSLRSKDVKYKPPKLIVLSSASVSPNFWTGIPDVVHSILFKALYFIYTDLQKAEAYLRDQGDWVSASFVVPGGIAHDVQRGHRLSEDEQQTFISFLDVAAGMIEVAEDESGRWDMRHVGVVGSSGVKAKVPWEAPVHIVKGLVVYCFPWLAGWVL